MSGSVDLAVKKDSLKVNLRLDQGNLGKILAGLDLKLPLEGRGKGRFEISEAGNLVNVRGDFSSPQLKIAGQILQDVEGDLELRGDALTFPRIRCKILGGSAQGKAGIDLKKREFDLDLAAEKIPLSALSTIAKGDLSLSLKGNGVLGRDKAAGSFEIKDLLLSGLPKLEVAGTLKLGYAENKLDLDINGQMTPGENEFAVALFFPLGGEPYSVDIKGSIGDLDPLLPWRGAKGRVNYRAEVRPVNGSPLLTGVIDFRGPLLPLPRFAQAGTDFSGLVFIQNNKASIRSFQAKLGGGDVSGTGEITLGKGGIESTDLRLEGKGMLLSPFERTRGLTDGSLRLVKDPNRFVLDGDFFFQKLSWRREAYEKFTFYSTPYYVPTEPSIFDGLTLNLHLRADDNAWIDNSLGRIKCRFDLNITGSVNEPLVMGEIDALSGEVYFQDRSFKVLKGRLSFFNPASLEPYLEFRGESFVKDYRVTFTLTGLISQLRPEFNSSPPLPPEDVLALLAMGESFKRTYSYDTSTRLSTASLLSVQIAEQAKKRAEGLFSLDRFRIDPFVLGSSAEMTARLTVGKKISRNFFVMYSTNLTTQREELARLEWEISNDFSLVGTRDELGRVSFDVKIRKRF
jgi:autotransporter translocation and assembly factor TamB